jgi:hypothetical protein
MGNPQRRKQIKQKINLVRPLEAREAGPNYRDYLTRSYGNKPVDVLDEISATLTPGSRFPKVSRQQPLDKAIHPLAEASRLADSDPRSELLRMALERFFNSKDGGFPFEMPRRERPMPPGMDIPF